jgi:hypothetical protein
MAQRPAEDEPAFGNNFVVGAPLIALAIAIGALWLSS